MLDIKFVKNNKEVVVNNLKKKFQEEKIPLVEEVIESYDEFCLVKGKCDELRAKINKTSKEISKHIKENKEKAEELKKEVLKSKQELESLQEEERKLKEKTTKKLMLIPNIIDPTVPIGKDDSENVEVERFLKAEEKDYEIPYHIDIMQQFSGVDIESARKTSGNGFYYLCGNIARLHSAILSYARDFIIERGFIYFIPPYMIHKEIVDGVMSFEEMQNMMYKVEGEDLYLIGTSEHSMIGRYVNTILKEEELPIKNSSFSPCFRKEVGAHGIEERGVFRIHQFEKQEMIVICKPQDSMKYFSEILQNTVDFFISLNIPVRTLECCSGDLADLKVKSIDVEAWSPRQKKYFEVGSCSNLGDAQARRLKIRIKNKDEKYFAHTLNNTLVAPPRMLIAFLENNYCKDKKVLVPQPLQKYMGGLKELVPN